MGRNMIREMMGHDPFEDDPFFRDPFGGFPGRGGLVGGSFDNFGGMQMTMGGFPSMNQMMMSGGGMGGGSSMVFQSSSFSSNGRTVHQSSTTARMGPGGVAEVQSQVRDGSGRERIMLERRLGDRARRVEKSRDLQSGEEETTDNTFGIEDGQEEQFDQEFHRAMRSHGYMHGHGRHGMISAPQAPQAPQARPARQIGYFQPEPQGRGYPSHQGYRGHGF